MPRSNVTVVTDRGQVSIPALVRKELNLVKGRRLAWERVSGKELRVIVMEDEEPVGANAVRGFARRFREEPRSSSEWMAELREGEA